LVLRIPDATMNVRFGALRRGRARPGQNAIDARQKQIVSTNHNGE
jgi:hypothetical protein